MKPLLSVLAATWLIVAPAWAQQAGSPITIAEAWARATPGNAKTGAAYLTIANTGAAADRLLSASSPIAAKVELHEDKMENGIMKMRPVGPLAIDAGKTEVIKPGGYHFMMTGLKQPLKQGESFPLTLHFEKAGDVNVAVKIERAGAMSPGDTGNMNMGGMNMGNMNGMDMNGGK